MDITSIPSVSTDMATASVAMTASIKVMDMADDVLEQAAAQLIAAMDAMITGVGGNIDTTA
jgi:hypothetical protein